MVESYLHKMAKELLYKEIEEKSGFEYKLSNGIEDFEPLIKRDDYRNECVLMEFPTKDGYYPDEFGCSAVPAEGECQFCNWYTKCGFEHSYDKIGECGGYVWDRWTWKCRHPGMPGMRFNKGNGYCKCSSCDSYNFKDSIVHDIAAFWKGNVQWAIEIINKHEPSWDMVCASMPYHIYFIKAEDVLKRVDSTPVFVYKIIKTGDPE